jgi:hypothetical protein
MLRHRPLLRLRQASGALDLVPKASRSQFIQKVLTHVFKICGGFKKSRKAENQQTQLSKSGVWRQESGPIIGGSSAGFQNYI